MLDSIKNRFNALASNSKFSEQLKAWQKTWHIIAPGQFIRLAEINGNYLAPQFVRHHMSNLADGFMVAASFNMLQMGVSAAINLPVKSRPILSSIGSASMLTAWEMKSAIPPNRTFDWVDMSLHAASIGTYVAFCHKDKIKSLIAPAPKN